MTTRTRPHRNGRPTPAPEPAAPEPAEAPDLAANAFPDASQELLQCVLGKIRWHHDQIHMQLGWGDKTFVPPLDSLQETANDARDIWALASLLLQSADTGR